MISPLLLGGQKAVDSDLDLECPQSPRRRPSAKGPSSKRLSGRPAVDPSPHLKPNKHSFQDFGFAREDDSPETHHHGHRHLEHLIDQVSEWIREERAKRADKKPQHTSTDGSSESKLRGTADDYAESLNERRDSNVSDTSFDLNKLEVSRPGQVLLGDHKPLYSELIHVI